MKTDVIKVDTSGAGVEEALLQTEAAAKYRGLNEKEALRLRLLSEEVLGLLKGLTGETESEFHIESRGRLFEIHTATTTIMDSKKRQKLLDASTTGENSAAIGFMGKLRNLYEKNFEVVDAVAPDYFSLGITGYVGDPLAYEYAAWSLSKYKDAIKDNVEAKSQWDELESSIVANLADEITVSIKGNDVEMVVYKAF